MEYKQAIYVLTNARRTLAGCGRKGSSPDGRWGLDWASLGKSKMESIAEKRKAKRDKDVQW